MRKLKRSNCPVNLRIRLRWSSTLAGSGDEETGQIQEVMNREEREK